jgi:hypothetical protein
MVLLLSSFTDESEFESIVRLVHGQLRPTISYFNIQNSENRQWTSYSDYRLNVWLIYT